MQSVRTLLRAKSMDELVVLPERTAVRGYFDDLNCRILFRLLIPLASATFLSALVLLAYGRFPELALAGATLVVIRLLYAGRDRPVFEHYFQWITIWYLSLQFVQLRSLARTDELTPIELILPFVLLFLRLSWPLLLVPLAALWGASAGRHLAVREVAEVEPWTIAGPTAAVLLVLALGHTLTKTAKVEFIDKWRTAQRRYHERRRMREELGDARKIQLSMLPAHDPRIGWLEVAGISIPASEVGGDYYDYFRISETRWVIVVADVAGHGVASGLLLSGIRSCLHLLHLGTPRRPVTILQQLDRMLRQTTARHFFVTLLYALFDADRGTVTWAAAGHPPLLHYRAETREVEELAQPSLPLGTVLQSSREQKSLRFDHDDIFLLYTDGIAETMNARGNVYGYQQLTRRLRATDHDRSAKEIRNTLLGDIVAFKGDEEQTDDITLVVAKVLGPSRFPEKS